MVIESTDGTAANSPVCPKCFKRSTRRNGRVRGSQRYRCFDCNLNFVEEPKHRWPADAKLLNLLMYKVGGESMEKVAANAGATVQTISRWLQEAQETDHWFVDAVARQLLFDILVQPVDSEEEKPADMLIKYIVMVVGPENPISATRAFRAVLDRLDDKTFFESAIEEIGDVDSMRAKVANVEQRVVEKLTKELL